MIRKIIIVCLLITCLYAQTAISPSAGDGSESNPYQIATLRNLYWITADSSNWDKHYIQTADIDASGTSNWYIGWLPIGNETKAFTGTYNGQYFKIDFLTIDNISRPMYNQGLFGVVRNAELLNIALINASMRFATDWNSESKVGLLAGYCDSSNVENCYSVGEVRCTNVCGGLIGKLTGNSTVSKCYTKGIIYAIGIKAGGIAGYVSNSLIESCYSDVFISAENDVGPITSYTSDDLSVNECYSSNIAMCDPLTYGIKDTNNFCLFYCSPWGSVYFRHTMITKVQLKDPMTYLNAGWDFVNETENGIEDIWDIDISGVINDGYPFLAWEHTDTTYFTSIAELQLPENYKLFQNYPNPFNPITTIGYAIPFDSHVKLTIYNISGRLVETLVDEFNPAGVHRVKWNASKYSSGIYIYRLETSHGLHSRKMLLIK